MDNIPFVLISGEKQTGYKIGLFAKFEGMPHNRLWLSLAQSFGHNLEVFGRPEHCQAGALDLA